MNITGSTTARYFPEINDDQSSNPILSPLNAIIHELKRKNVVAAAGGPNQMSLALDSRSDPWGSSEAALGIVDDGIITSFSSSGDGGGGGYRMSSSIPDFTMDREKIANSYDKDNYNNPKAILCTCYQQRLNCSTSPVRSLVRDNGGEIEGRDDDVRCLYCGKLLPSANHRRRADTTSSCSIDANLTSGPQQKLRLNSWLTSSHKERLDAPRHAEELLQVTPQLRIISSSSTDMNGMGASTSDNILSTILSSTPFKNHFNTHNGHSINRNKNSSSSPRDSSHRNIDTSSSSSIVSTSDYNDSLKRDRANHQAATELASLLWICAHEMSLEDYGMVESETFTSVFSLVHSKGNTDRRMAGLAALNALIDAPSADEERKAIKFANTLSGGLRSARGDYEFLSAVSKALGHMATRTANVDFVESEVIRALEWLRTDRSDRRLAATLALKEFAIHAPTAFYSKTSQSTLGQGGSNEFLEHIFQAVRDPQPIVRACAADALSQCLKILMERQHMSLTSLLCQVHFSVMDGLNLHTPNNSWTNPAVTSKIETSQHGSLLVVATMIAHTRDFMLPRYEEVCCKVIELMSHPKLLIRLELVKLLPRLAQRCPKVFARRYLEKSLNFLLATAATIPLPRVGVDIRPSAYSSIGLLVLAMVDQISGDLIGGANLPSIKIIDDPEHPGELHIVELCETGTIDNKLDEIFALVSKGLKYRSTSSSRKSTVIHIAAFHCAADLIKALGETAQPYINGLIDDMFNAGLSNDLIQCLHAIAKCVPEQQNIIEDRLFQEVSICLAGIQSARVLCDPLLYTQSTAGAWCRQPPRILLVDSSHSSPPIESGIEDPTIRINMSSNPSAVKGLVLGLQTLGTFGDYMGRVTTFDSVVPILPFVQNVAAPYLSHPSSEIRRAAALTCCVLLVPPGIMHRKRVGSQSAMIIENVLDMLLRVAVSDPSPVVRLCVVRALDSRYDPFLCQADSLQTLLLLLQDEAMATRAAGVRLLGRLASLNPAPILPFMKKFLMEAIVELKCGVDTGRGREEATRLLVVFLRSKSLRRLVHPVLPAMIGTLPLNGGTPRLASAAMEALGELAKTAGVALQPWVKEIVPNILDTLQDQSSSSKQRASLRTLAQIAGSTGYVIQPYIDYPKLMSQATDILPGTKRAPWSLRREVIRTLGVLGALDPDLYNKVAPQARKGGAVGGAYFIVQDEKSINIDGADTVSNDVSIGNPLSSVRTIGGIDRGIARLSSSKQLWKTSSSFVAGGKFSLGPSEPFKKINDSDDDLPAHLLMYEQYAMVAQPVSSHTPARRMTPVDEAFYPTVAIQALMRVFKDPSLAVHHGMVMQAIMFIFKSLGIRCVPFLNQVVPHVMVTIQTCGPSNLRESLLKQVATLSGIVREHLRPYVADIFDIVEKFLSSRHLSTIFSLISHIAVGVPDEFKFFVPRLIRLYLCSLDEIQIAEWVSTEMVTHHRRGLQETERLRLILCSIRSLRGVLGNYLHILVPALLKLSDSLLPLISDHLVNDNNWLINADLENLSVLMLQTTSALLECEGAGNLNQSMTPYWGEKNEHSGNLSARIIQPLIRLITRSDKTVGLAVVQTICVCARQLGVNTWIKLYHTVVRIAIVEWHNNVGHDDFQNQGRSPNHNASVNRTSLKHGLQHYDEVIKELQTTPLQRSYMNPYIIESHRVPLRQNSIENGVDQHGFTDNLGIAPNFDNSNEFDTVVTNMYHQSLSQSNKSKINQAQLQRAWDVSQCASRDDWDEWMRRLGIQLLREAPSPALRASASLAHAYQPLSRELFSAAFVCCWKELSEPYRINLVHALEAAFVADISPEILQALLNLAEFMEHDPSGGLPIDISILANLALKCRAYAKALHYKEQEHNMNGGSSCVEALISINRKLDLQEAALGVLKSATMRFEEQQLNDDLSIGTFTSNSFTRQQNPHEMSYSVVWSTEDNHDDNLSSLDLVENKERWLAKLGSWTDALEVYEEKLIRNPSDFDATLGCMRCLSSSGEWGQVLELAEDKWPTISAGTAFQNEAHDASVVSQPTAVASREHRKAILICAKAAWRLGRWDDLEKYSSELVHGQGNNMNAGPSAANGSRDGNIPRVDFDGAFFSAVLHVHREEWHLAAEAIDAARKAMDGRFTALMAESYNRAYPSIVTAQTLAEMEEIIEYRKVEKGSQGGAHRHPANRLDPNEARERLLSVWRDRLAGCRVDAEVHYSIMAVRSLILGPEDEVDATLTLSKLSRQAQRFKLAEHVLLDPLQKLSADLNGAVFGFGLTENLGLRTELDDALKRIPIPRIIDNLVANDDNCAYLPHYSQVHHQWSNQLVQEAGGLERLTIQHKLYFAFLKHLWLTDRRDEALHRLSRLCDVVDMTSHCESIGDQSLRSACWLELGAWKIQESTAPNSFLPELLQVEVLSEFKRATLMNGGYKAWHNWALLNFRIAEQLNESDDGNGNRRKNSPVSSSQKNHVVTAIKSFVNAISIGTKRWSASVQQDMLNFLTCLFQYGEQPAIASIINQCVESVPIETWLGVLPQLLARIHLNNPSIRSVLHPLLVRLGEKHPQALMYPLSVLLKSPVAERKSSAESLMNSLRSHSSALVEEALMVSSELIRVAILWLETWHEGLEEASRLYFGEGNVSGMLDLLLPLHEKIEKGAETRRESEFINTFGADLTQAHQHIKDYVRLVSEDGDTIPTGLSSSNAYDPSGRQIRQNEEAETAMNKAWDIYYTVFRRINKQLPALTKLELSDCSPALSKARSLELGVPGSYRVDGSYIKIEKFIPSVQVITSKQRPRKITLRGSDGKDYVFLLKGHEDLRQDERVMQLFGLVNALLERDRQTKKHDLRIQRYAISPLSHNCGLVGWVPHTDTLHSLIRDYRQTKKIPLNLEHREMLRIAPDYDQLTVMQKVEVFTDALKKTTGGGNDLYEILWLKSTNSEEWLERRTRYTRSLAVMSMVGYILGLGDRHPSNLMLDKLSGRVLHIDFGDCFEVAMNRDKFPEKVPFRLTRMLIKAMEVSGIEGSYRSTCERTMTVLRENRDSLVAMLQAFLYDPLISWRLVDLSNNNENAHATNRMNDDNRLTESVLSSARDIVTGNNSIVDDVDVGVPIDVGSRPGVLPITEGDEDEDEEEEEEKEIDDLLLPNGLHDQIPSVPIGRGKEFPMSATRARSLQMYSNIQTWAANLGTDGRIESVTGGDGATAQVAASGTHSIARSRIAERSMRQRELMSILDSDEGLAAEEALNEKALKIIRRIQDKLNGTDFEDRAESGETLGVVDQVQSLTVQATSVENLSQLFIGWCAFW
mmetsp:Transcript_48383/g.54822  ORF Transcript_48383/g.54822 Transcript_48383/m.54822 type:complete len:3288 (-) Transcript_48383:257-10120(-)